MSNIQGIRIKGINDNPTIETGVDYVLSHCRSKNINQTNALAYTLLCPTDTDQKPKLSELAKDINVDFVAAYHYIDKNSKSKPHHHHYHIITKEPIVGCSYIVDCKRVGNLDNYVYYMVKGALDLKNALYHCTAVTNTTTTRTAADYEQPITAIEPEPTTTSTAKAAARAAETSTEPGLYEVNSNDRIEKKQPFVSSVSKAITSAMGKVFSRFYGWLNKPIQKANSENITLFISELNSNKPKTNITMNLSEEIEDGYNAAYEGYCLSGTESPFFIEGYNRGMQEKQKNLSDFLESV